MIFLDDPNDPRGEFGYVSGYNQGLHGCIDVAKVVIDETRGPEYNPPLGTNPNPLTSNNQIRNLFECMHAASSTSTLGWSCSGIGPIFLSMSKDNSVIDRGFCVKADIDNLGVRAQAVVCAFRYNQDAPDVNGLFDPMFAQFAYDNDAEFGAAPEPTIPYCHVRVCVQPPSVDPNNPCSSAAPSTVRTLARRLNGAFYGDRTGTDQAANLLDGAVQGSANDGCVPRADYAPPLAPNFEVTPALGPVWWANGFLPQPNPSRGWAYVQLGSVRTTPPMKYRIFCVCKNSNFEPENYLSGGPGDFPVQSVHSCVNCVFPFFGLNCALSLFSYGSEQCHHLGGNLCGTGVCVGLDRNGVRLFPEALGSDLRRAGLKPFDDPAAPPELLVPDAVGGVVLFFCECQDGFYGGACRDTCSPACSNGPGIFCENPDFNAPTDDIPAQNLYVLPLPPACVCSRGYYADSAGGASAAPSLGGDPDFACWTCKDISGRDVPECGGAGSCVRSIGSPFTERPSCLCVDGSISTTGCKIRPSYTFDCGPQLGQVLCEPDPLLISNVLENLGSLTGNSWSCATGLVTLPAYNSASPMTTELQIRFVKLVVGPVGYPDVPSTLVYTSLIDDATFCRVFLEAVPRLRVDPRDPAVGVSHLHEQLYLELGIDQVRVAMWHNGVLVIGDPEVLVTAAGIGRSATARLAQAALHDSALRSALGAGTLYPDNPPRTVVDREFSTLGPCPDPYSRRFSVGYDGLDVCPIPVPGSFVDIFDDVNQVTMLAVDLGTPETRVECFRVQATQDARDRLAAASNPNFIAPEQVALEFHCLPALDARETIFLDCEVALSPGAVVGARGVPLNLVQIINDQCLCRNPLCLADDPCNTIWKGLCVAHASCSVGPRAEPVCTCDPGFEGDGLEACTDVDECLTVTCPAPEPTDPELCYNTFGSFYCSACSPAQRAFCPANFGTCMRGSGQLVVTCGCLEGFVRNGNVCDHPLLPSSLMSAAGARFRYVTVTEGALAATGADYAFYENFAQADADTRSMDPSDPLAELDLLIQRGYVSIFPADKQWGALVGVSPPTPSLLDRLISVTGNNLIPTFSLDNPLFSKVSLTDLLNIAGTELFPFSNQQIEVWTGIVDGSALDPATFALGEGDATFGLSQSTSTQDMLNPGLVAPVEERRPLYAVSPVFRINNFPP